MKHMPALCLVLVLAFLVVGCNEEKTPEPHQAKKIDWDKRIADAANQEEDKPKSSDLPSASHGGVTVNISPEQPVAGDCLVASFKGKPANTVFTWEINSIYAQESEDSRYCPEDARRGDIITVTVGDHVAGSTASVTFGNTPPRVIDTRIEIINDGEGRAVVITPEIEDVDEDFVAIEYQWLINGEVAEDYTENRLPAKAFQKGDEVQVRITVNDGYAQGAPYMSRNVNVPGGAPEITSRPPGAFESMVFTYQVKATDPDGGQLTYDLEASPEGMTIDAETGKIDWPLNKVAPGNYRIKIVVSDPDGDTAVQEFTLNLGERKAPARQ